jgi:small subunit ribosomal protein S8
MEGEKMVDHLADALNTLKTHEMAGQKDCSVKSTKLVRSVVELLKQHNYLSNFDVVDNGKGGTMNIELDGRINDCGVIRPRISVKRTQWARWEQQFIPGVGVGLLIVSTPKGIMTNRDAEAAHIGGRLLAYVY